MKPSGAHEAGSALEAIVYSDDQAGLAARVVYTARSVWALRFPIGWIVVSGGEVMRTYFLKQSHAMGGGVFHQLIHSLPVFSFSFYHSTYENTFLDLKNC